MGVIVPKLRQSARGQSCTLNLPSCNHDPDTTVLAHLSSVVKGVGNKGDDWHAVFACSNCHYDLDNHVWNDFHTLEAVTRGIQRTQAKWVEMGLMSFPAKAVAPPKSSPKILNRRHIATGEPI